MEFIALDFAPRQKVLYNKEIQTEDAWLDKIKQTHFAPEPDYDAESKSPTMSHVGILKEGTIAPSESSPPPARPATLPPDQIQTILESERFRDFVDHSSKLVERALNLSNRYDFMIDYSATQEVIRVVREKIKVTNVFESDKLTLGRTVTDLQWSP